MYIHINVHICNIWIVYPHSHCLLCDYGCRDSQTTEKWFCVLEYVQRASRWMLLDGGDAWIRKLADITREPLGSRTRAAVLCLLDLWCTKTRVEKKLRDLPGEGGGGVVKHFQWQNSCVTCWSESGPTFKVGSCRDDFRWSCSRTSPKVTELPVAWGGLTLWVRPAVKRQKTPACTVNVVVCEQRLRRDIQGVRLWRRRTWSQVSTGGKSFHHIRPSEQYLVIYFFN